MVTSAQTATEIPSRSIINASPETSSKLNQIINASSETNNSLNQITNPSSNINTAEGLIIGPSSEFNFNNIISQRTGTNFPVTTGIGSIKQSLIGASSEFNTEFNKFSQIQTNQISSVHSAKYSKTVQSTPTQPIFGDIPDIEMIFSLNNDEISATDPDSITDKNSTVNSAIDFINLNNSVVVDQNTNLVTSGAVELVVDSVSKSKTSIFDSQLGSVYTPTLNFKNVQDQPGLNGVPKNYYMAYTTYNDSYNNNNMFPIYSSGNVIPTSISVLPTSLAPITNGYYAGVMPTITGYSRVFPKPSFSDHILPPSENTLSPNNVLPTILPSSLISVTPTSFSVLPTSFSVLPTSFSVLPTSFSVLPTSESVSNLPTIQTSISNIISNLYYANIPAPTSATNNIYYSNAQMFTSIIPNLYYSGSIPSSYLSMSNNIPNPPLPPPMASVLPTMASVLPTSALISNFPLPSLSTMPIIPSVSSEIQNLAIPSLQQNIPTEQNSIPAQTDSTITVTSTPTITMINTLQTSVSVLPISASEGSHPLIPNSPPKDQTTLSDSIDSTIIITSTPTITLTNTILNTSPINLAVAPESIAPPPVLQLSSQISTILSTDSLLATLSSNPIILLPIKSIASPTINYNLYVLPTSAVVNSYKAKPPMYGYMNNPIIVTSDFSSGIRILPTSIVPTTPIPTTPPISAPIDHPASTPSTVLPITSIPGTPNVLPTSITPTTPIPTAPPISAPIDHPTSTPPTVLPITSIPGTPSVLPTSIIPTTPIPTTPPISSPIDHPASTPPTVLPITSISGTPSVHPTSIIPTTPIPIAPPISAPIDLLASTPPTVLPITTIPSTPSVLPTSIVPITPIPTTPPISAPVDNPASTPPTVLPITSTPEAVSTTSSEPPVETPLVTQINPTTSETITGYSGPIYVAPSQVSYIYISPTTATQPTVTTPNCAAKYFGGSLDPICISLSSISVLPTSTTSSIGYSYPVYVSPTSQSNYKYSVNYVFSFSTSILPTKASISYNTDIQYNYVDNSSDVAKTYHPASTPPTVLPITSISGTPSVHPTSIIPTTPIPIAPPISAPIDLLASTPPTVLPITTIPSTPSVLPTSIVPITPIPTTPPISAPVDNPASTPPTVLPITSTPEAVSTTSSEPPVETPLVTQINPTTSETITGYSGPIYVAPSQVSYIYISPTTATQPTVTTPNCAAKYFGGSLDPICISLSSISVLPTSTTSSIGYSYPVYVSPTSQSNYKYSVNYVFSFSTSILPTKASIIYNTDIQYNYVDNSSDVAKTCNAREYKCLIADGEGSLYNFCDDSQVLRLYQCPLGTRCYSPKPGNRNVDCLPIGQNAIQNSENQSQNLPIMTPTISSSDNNSGSLTNLSVGSTFSESSPTISNVPVSINSNPQSEINSSIITINTAPSNGVTNGDTSSATTTSVVNAAITDTTSNNLATGSIRQIGLNGLVLPSSTLPSGVMADKEILVTPKVKLIPTIG
ncbi:hypothetical protein AYI70_g818 [Smittium culicis]|uniref:Uncharacterized protein n=1 Tax=Smittium culicis TaxID=133412 RepID=A0A1R1YF70_9FUNG|nr:hypothetical protein AYI70_g818 [Smittium culicis]